ncbi:hypothetical protein PMAYCL1PPCAC_18966, partial [Pristionchus mayeri]
QLLVLSSELVRLLGSLARLLLVTDDGIESLFSSRMGHIHSQDQRRLIGILQTLDTAMREGREAELDGSSLRQDLEKEILGRGVGDAVSSEYLVRLPHCTLGGHSVDDVTVVFDGSSKARLAAREDPDQERDVLDVALLLQIGTL